jgi:hypothetical protein
LFLFYNFPHYVLFFIIFYLSLIPRFPHYTASELMRDDCTYQKSRWILTHFETENKQKGIVLDLSNKNTISVRYSTVANMVKIKF